LKELGKPPEANVQLVVQIAAQQFSVALLKNTFDFKLLSLVVSEASLSILGGKASETNAEFTARVAVSYFNKRKMVEEPFLEPWVFSAKLERRIQNQSIDFSSSWKNVEVRAADRNNEIILHHSNSLNLNLSNSAIETFIEMKNIYESEIEY